MTNDGWRENQSKNVFQMFMSHGEAGFWVRRITWETICARVVRVGEITGPAPYFGNPSVLMDVYTLDGRLKSEVEQLPVPGTFKTWREIEAPAWAATAILRPLDDRVLDVALAHLDKKRHKGGPNPQPEKIWLRVPYDRKEEAKSLGARWSAKDKAWWLPASNEAALSKAHNRGFLK